MSREALAKNQISKFYHLFQLNLAKRKGKNWISKKMRTNSAGYGGFVCCTLEHKLCLTWNCCGERKLRRKIIRYCKSKMYPWGWDKERKGTLDIPCTSVRYVRALCLYICFLIWQYFMVIRTTLIFENNRTMVMPAIISINHNDF